MENRDNISMLIYGMTLAVLFGAGVVAVLATPLEAQAAIFIPAVAAVAALLALPVAYWLAPRLMTPADTPRGVSSGLFTGRRDRLARPAACARETARARTERNTRKFD